MSTNTKNVPAPAATGVEDNKSIAERSTPSLYAIAHLEHRMKSTGVDVVFHDGNRAPHGEYVHILVRRDALVDAFAANEELTVHVCRSCVERQGRRFREQQAREELHRQVEAEVRTRLAELEQEAGQ